MGTLAEQLEQRLREANSWRPLDRSRVACFAAGDRCPTSPGCAGVYKVPYNRGRKLYTHVNAVSCGPIEMKPLYRGLLGTGALSFGMLGSDLHCRYCQNSVQAGQIGQNAHLLHVFAGNARGCTRDREKHLGSRWSPVGD